MKTFADILRQNDFSGEDIRVLLDSGGNEMTQLLEYAHQVRQVSVGNKVFFRGLVEFSNVCSKDCFYCGIRKGNSTVKRYTATDEEILAACRFAWENGFGSVVLQSGELSSTTFVERVDRLLRKIKQMSRHELGITLSCGEQLPETYKQWFSSGAHRYLLRIEASNRDLYNKIHPQNEHHSYDRRIKALQDLKEAGYQVGTGVMIGLPFQSTEDLANDLLFFKELDIDMCGMGPYVEHERTPLHQYNNILAGRQERYETSLKMIACLRLLMPDINIAAATALQAIDPLGREKALNSGANVIMPNLTPCEYRKEYRLYNNKPCLDEDEQFCRNYYEARLELAGFEVGYNQWGDSRHFHKRKQNQTKLS